ncbi:MAG TPA: cupredoxin domain-containing protein [Rhizomicrobium sp.]|nr:cupredoxin domain-containing protein [Rhizomicrobium sp.]
MPAPAIFVVPTSRWHGLIFAIALLLPIGGASAQTTVPITVTLTDYAFSPGALDLKQGVVYQIHFTNNGSKSHNFSAPEFFADSQIAPEDVAKVKNGTVEISNAQSADITVTPGRPGAYAFVCTHFMHKMMGMHGEISVQ